MNWLYLLTQTEHILHSHSPEEWLVALLYHPECVWMLSKPESAHCELILSKSPLPRRCFPAANRVVPHPVLISVQYRPKKIILDYFGLHLKFRIKKMVMMKISPFCSSYSTYEQVTVVHTLIQQVAIPISCCCSSPWRSLQKGLIE